MSDDNQRRVLALAAAFAAVLACRGAAAASIDWMGHSWQVTDGGMAGVCNGSPANVSVDSDGYLHLRISNSGGTWTAAEIFTTDKLGFGTYQWHLDGPIDSYDKNIVVGLFPYGPAAGIGADGTNEIDIEYSRWGQANGDNGDFTDYPATGKTVGELSYTFSLDGSTLSTSRFTWTDSSITSSLLNGIVDIGATDNTIQTYRYAPTNPTQNIPQQALPLGMNFWCFDAPPSDGQPAEIVIRDFTFVAQGSGMAGAGGMGSGGSANGSAGASGRAGAASGTGGTAGAGARAGAGGKAAQGGAGGMTAMSGAGAGGRTGTNTGGRRATGGMDAGGSGVVSNGGSHDSPGGAGATSSGAGTTDTASGGTGTTSSGAGTAGAPSSAGAGTTAPDVTQDHGCGCAVPRAEERRLPLALLSAVVLLVSRRRRTDERA